LYTIERITQGHIWMRTNSRKKY